MSSNGKILAAIIVVIVVVGGGYALFHKSSKPSTSSSTNAAANAVIVTKTDPTVGQYLADPAGRTLYTYGADKSGVSNCTASCLISWPAYTTTSSASNLPSGVTIIKRSDNGKKQYAYNGKPLYYFVSDAPGKVTGNKVDNFQVAKPSGASSSSSSTSNASNSSSGSNY